MSQRAIATVLQFWNKVTNATKAPAALVVCAVCSDLVFYRLEQRVAPAIQKKAAGKQFPRRLN